jgi:hypothetical protein
MILPFSTLGNISPVFFTLRCDFFFSFAIPSRQWQFCFIHHPLSLQAVLQSHTWDSHWFFSRFSSDLLEVSLMCCNLWNILDFYILNHIGNQI